MLDYILEVPEPDCSHNRGHKFPFVVSDVLSNENSNILDAFFTDEAVEVEDDLEEEGEDEENKAASPFEGTGEEFEVTDPFKDENLSGIDANSQDADSTDGDHKDNENTSNGKIYELWRPLKPHLLVVEPVLY